jgi:hypothetical protein
MAIHVNPSAEQNRGLGDVSTKRLRGHDQVWREAEETAGSRAKDRTVNFAFAGIEKRADRVGGKSHFEGEGFEGIDPYDGALECLP